MFDPVLFLPCSHDAVQAPAHRWLRCDYLLEFNRRPTPHDDALTQEAYAFLRDWRHCALAAQRELLARRHPALSEAVQIYQDGMTPQRAELEARLLAGQDDPGIADRCHLTPAVVQLFHGLFFEVRPHLQSHLYIVNVAIGPKVHHSLTANDHDVLLKIAGYTLGASGLDALLAYWAHPLVWPVCLAGLDDAS